MKLVRGNEPRTSLIQSKKCVKMFVYLHIVLFYCYLHVYCHSRHYHWRQYTRYSRSWMGHVTLSVETTILVPYLVVESLRRSWGAGARGFHLRVPDLQVGWNFNAGLPRGLKPGDTPCCCCCYCYYYYNIITKDVVPRDHCLVFILSGDVMPLLFLVLFFWK